MIATHRLESRARGASVRRQAPTAPSMGVRSACLAGPPTVYTAPIHPSRRARLMLLNLSDRSNDTLQGQLIRQIRGLILGGDLPPGSELPSIRGLAHDQKVSVVTVQR